MPSGATKPTHHNERNPKHCKEDPVQPKLKEKKKKECTQKKIIHECQESHMRMCDNQITHTLEIYP